MSDRLMQRMLSPIQRAISNMASRATVVLVNAAGNMQRVQLRLLNGEAKSELEHFETYGLTSHPKIGAEGLAIFFQGDRSHGAVICVGDRRYRLKGLAAGEVALHDDIGHKVHLTRDGIVINGAGHPLLVTNTPNARFETPRLEVTGDIIDNCDTSGRSMASMREVYNGHNHAGDSGGVTGQPNQDM